VLANFFAQTGKITKIIQTKKTLKSHSMTKNDSFIHFGSKKTPKSPQQSLSRGSTEARLELDIIPWKT
jgi:hypothetical protein